MQAGWLRCERAVSDAGCLKPFQPRPCSGPASEVEERLALGIGHRGQKTADSAYVRSDLRYRLECSEVFAHKRCYLQIPAFDAAQAERHSGVEGKAAGFCKAA